MTQEELAAAQRQLAEAAGWRDAVAAKDAELATLQVGAALYMSCLGCASALPCTLLEGHL